MKILINNNIMRKVKEYSMLEEKRIGVTLGKLSDQDSFDYIKYLIGTNNINNLALLYNKDENRYYLSNNNNYISTYDIDLSDYKDNREGYEKFIEDYDKSKTETDNITSIVYGSELCTSELLIKLSYDMIRHIDTDYNINAYNALDLYNADLDEIDSLDTYYDLLKDVNKNNKVTKKYIYNKLDNALKNEYKYRLIKDDRSCILFGAFSDERLGAACTPLEESPELRINCTVEDLFGDKGATLNQINFDQAERIYKRYYSKYGFDQLGDLMFYGRCYMPQEREIPMESKTAQQAHKQIK